MPRAAALGKHVMMAGIDADNAALDPFAPTSALIERSGQLREVGYKFGRWLDLVFLQRRI